MPVDRLADDLALDALRWICQAGLSKQTSAAAALGVSPSTVNRWLTGDRRPAEGQLRLSALFIHLGDDAPKLGFWLANRLREREPPVPLQEAVREARRRAAALLKLLIEIDGEEPTRGWWAEVQVESRDARMAFAELEEAELPQALREVA